MEVWYTPGAVPHQVSRHLSHFTYHVSKNDSCQTCHKKFVTGQLGHHPFSLAPEDDLQKVVACMPFPQVVKMFKGDPTF
jgi:hypothetical protein